MRTYHVGNWLLGAYSDQNSAFQHCAASVTYHSGVTVFFSINRNYQWSIGFSHPRWKYIVGRPFSVTFAVDESAPITASGHVFIPTGVEVNLDPTSALFNLFRHGRLLRVAGTQSVFQFYLTGTNAVLTSLLECVKLKGQAPQMVASSPQVLSNAAGAATPGVGDRAIYKAEATAMAANILSAAHIDGFHLLEPDERPDIKGDARWAASDLFGTIDVLPQLKPDDIKSVGGYVIANDAKACKGAFLSGAMPGSDAAAGRIFTSCQIGGKMITTYYMAVPRRSGGAYVIATSSFGDEKPAKAADSSIRAAVLHLEPKTSQ
jgi:hypothetical protein